MQEEYDADDANSVDTNDMLSIQSDHEGDNENDQDLVVEQDHQDRLEISHRKTLISSLQRFLGVHYTKVSVAIMLVYVISILRNTKQVYIALVFLSTSKISYIIFGNAIISLFVAFFYRVVENFLGGLRLMEMETVQDKLRWSIADTCFALTVFRPEVNVAMIGMFLMLILAKAFHWAIDLRGNHIRVTDDIFDTTPYTASNGRKYSIIPQSFYERWMNFIPIMKWSHFKFFTLCCILLTFDVSTLYLCTSQLLMHGPSAYIYFGFEAAILLSSVLSTVALFVMHIVDGLMNILQRFYADKDTLEEDGSTTHNQSSQISSDIHHLSTLQKISQQLTCLWRENRATLSISIELVAQAAKFLFSFTLFSAVLLYYGLPFSILREVYFSYQKLRDRLSSFASYQRLTRNMNERFDSVDSDTELDSAGRTCIICRERMDSHGVFGGCKKLPICGHIFHKHCLREWLVQQQSCPTCRSDIQANEIKAKAQRLSRAKEEAELVHVDDSSKEIEGIETSMDEHERLLAHHDQKDLPGLTMTRDEESRREDTILFPALFRIVGLQTVSVVSFTPVDAREQYFYMNNVKTIATGKVIICSERRRFSCISSSEGASLDSPTCAYFIRSPDGWIPECAAEPLCTLSS